MKRSITEQQILDNYLSDLLAEGFDVIASPSKSMLPKFLQDFMPDAIASKGNQNLIIEVLGTTKGAKEKLDRLLGLAADNPQWEVRAVGLSPQPSQKTLDAVLSTTIASTNDNIARLLDSEQIKAALLLAWASFEATARILLPTDFRRPQTPGRLVEVLAGGGIVTPDEADELRALANKRNQIIHGGLDETISKDEVERFYLILVNLEKRINKKLNR